MDEEVADWETQGLKTYLRIGEGVRGLSGLFGGRFPCLPFPGGGIGFLGGTTGAAGLDGLWSGIGLSTEKEKRVEKRVAEGKTDKTLVKQAYDEENEIRRRNRKIKWLVDTFLIKISFNYGQSTRTVSPRAHLNWQN